MVLNKYIIFTTILLTCVQSTSQDQQFSTNDLSDITNTSSLNSVKRVRMTPIMFRISVNEEPICVDTEADFPSFLTPEQRRNGGVIISFLIGIYCFTLLAILCDKYFLPCVERICEVFNMSQDVAAATFMAMATSAPELFVNVIGTFITESDIGIGTVVGSSIFNCLGVAALGSLAASSPIQLDWWPVTRDTTLYITAISLLVVITWDGSIYWYEGLILFIVYFFYFVVMFNNKRISKHVRDFVNRFSTQISPIDDIVTEKPQETKSNTISSLPPSIYIIDETRKSYLNIQFIENNNKSDQFMKPISYYEVESISCKEHEIVAGEMDNEASDWSKLTTLPGKFRSKICFFYLWPIRFLFYCVIPNPKTYPKLFPLTFLMCVVFLGLNSYVVSWMISIIGHTFSISDTLLGLTLLAAGGCLPEAMSIIIMSRRGEGSMGVSNALGANTMNILLSLGLPWFIKTIVLKTSNLGSFIEVTSGSIEYTILGLIIVAMMLFFVLFFNQFRLSRRIGVILLVVYAIFLSFAIMIEVFHNHTEPC